MNQATATDIAEQAAREALKLFNKEQNKTVKRRNLRNTKKLMENYKAIKANIEDGISEITDTCIDFTDELDESDLFIASIRRSKFRSAIMISHIDAAIGRTGQELSIRGEAYKRDMFLDMYITKENVTYESLAEEYDCSPITARRWVNEVNSRLSVHLFGVEGLQFE